MLYTQTMLCVHRNQHDHCLSLTLVIFYCSPENWWFFSNVNLYLHPRCHTQVIGVHLVKAGATGSLGLLQRYLKLETGMWMQKSFGLGPYRTNKQSNHVCSAQLWVRN